MMVETPSLTVSTTSEISTMPSPSPWASINLLAYLNSIGAFDAKGLRKSKVAIVVCFLNLNTFYTSFDGGQSNYIVSKAKVGCFILTADNK